LGPPPERPPAGGPAGRRVWSLRARLGAAVAVLVAVACLVVGVTTVVVLDRTLYRQVDAQLTTAAGRTPRGFGEAVGPGPVPPGQPAPGCDPRPRPGDFPRGQAIGTLMARVCDGTVREARVLPEYGQSEPDVTAAYPTLLAVPADGRPRTYDLGDRGPYRILARPTNDGTVLITGLPLTGTRETLVLVGGVVAGMTLLALLAAGLAGAVIVRRTLRPLSRVAATATLVSELRLDRGEVPLPQRVADVDTDPRTEVGQVGAALNRMLEHVDHALRVRQASETQVRQFVADASHELRTPLASIRGYAELSRRGRTPVPDEVAHMLRRVESEAERMTTLVEDLLLLARIDSGRPLVREPVDLSALSVDAVSDAHAAGPDHEWRLRLPDGPVSVTGDPARLHQVLANLLANARTHTPPGTVVEVGVATEPTSGQAILRVSDAGPGIPADLLPHVFRRFARGGRSRSRAAGGTGLGLAIVHAVITAHGGTVAVASRPGRTEFTVRLPAHGGIEGHSWSPSGPW
jgi:two-component system, OmpR family, sensor kinase